MEKRGRNKNKKAQIWVETVVYTLIGLSIIGVVLGIAMPKLKEIGDKATLEQTITLLTGLNKEIGIVMSATGTSRLVYIKVDKGEMKIDCANELIVYTMQDTGFMYSQPGKSIPQGELMILTEEKVKNKRYDIQMTLNVTAIHSSLDLTFDSTNTNKVLTQAPTAYQILIKNNGGGKIDLSIV